VLNLTEPEHTPSTVPVVVPYTELSDEVLRGVVESFVLREGTDYGEREFSLDQKVEHVLRQLRRGEARIVFDPATETVDIVVVTGGRASDRVDS
jgi:uncharacterized protein